MKPASFGGMPPFEIDLRDFDQDVDDDAMAPSARFDESRSSMTGGEILHAADDREGREELARGLRRLGYEVVTASAVPRSAQLARTHGFKYAAVDVSERRGRGLELIAELRRTLFDVRIVAMVRHGTVETALDAMAHGAQFYLAKPVSAAHLSNALVGGRRSPPRAATLTLADCEGNVSETARRLGITRRTVQLKLKHGPPT